MLSVVVQCWHFGKSDTKSHTHVSKISNYGKEIQKQITENQDGTEKVHVLKSTEKRSKITRGKSDKEETGIEGEKSEK